MTDSTRIEWGIRAPDGTVYPIPAPTNHSRPPKINTVECEWVQREVVVSEWESFEHG